jgi:lysophospholipase L1-like esterase
MTHSTARNTTGIKLTLCLAATCLAIALCILCSNHGVGLLPESLRYLPGATPTGIDRFEPGYRLFLSAIHETGEKRIPESARVPQIILFAICIAAVVITIQRRHPNVMAPLLTGLLLIFAPQTLRLFTVLSPQVMAAPLVICCLLTAEEYGRTMRTSWLYVALACAFLMTLTTFAGLVVFLAIPLAIDSARRHRAAWGHLFFAIAYCLASIPIYHANVAFISTLVAASACLAVFLGSAVSVTKAVWLLAILVIAEAAISIPGIVHAEREGHDFAEIRWKHSPTIEAINRVRGEQMIFGDTVEPLVIYSRHPAASIQNTKASELSHTLTTTDSFIVLFGDAHRDIALLNAQVPLEEYRVLSDGQILRADASVWAGGKRTPAYSQNTPFIPARRAAGHFEWWNEKHEGYVRQAAAGNIDLLFLGDSITDDFRKVPGAWDFFQERFAKYHAANFGIDGDHTQHLLFRILNGECDHIHPRVAVILIGTNNTADDSAASIAKGIEACVNAARQKMPQTRILLLGLFPRGESPTNNDKRPVIQAVNRIIAHLDNGKTVRFLNLYDKFLAPDGRLSKQIMYDGLHPSLEGYHIWLDAMQPLLDEMMRLSPATAP